MMQSSSSDCYAIIYSIKIFIFLTRDCHWLTLNSEVQTTLVLQYKKTNYHKRMYKNFHSTAKLIAHDADINKTFKSTHESVSTKIFFLEKFGLLKQWYENFWVLG